ncbi:hypothetical protein O7623_15350 [Solwaraspora sp. WMMD791]|uniref:hypothetical protein n=1 Tax=Solwaraspora sp. WMMD791 TaxID=3016086 RepID=UPI00249C348A|nr:hypothetical protein [Solwaraspora sp. WMMD791]WFE24816.1 hypothetical protein O7623_15350 [Solwaraspora sp. WMMD791]
MSDFMGMPLHPYGRVPVESRVFAGEISEDQRRAEMSVLVPGSQPPAIPELSEEQTRDVAIRYARSVVTDHWPSAEWAGCLTDGCRPVDTALQLLRVEDFNVYERLAELLRDGKSVEMITDEE